MAISTDPSDPHFGLETDPSHPNFGLPEQQTDTLAQPSQTEPSQSREATRPTFSLPSLTESIFGKPAGETVQHAIQAAGDVAQSIPGMIEQIPSMAYQAAKFRVGGPLEREQVAGQALAGATQQGQQIAQDVQAPLGSRESFRGFANLGMLALPAVGEFARPALTEAIFGRAKPPVQETPLSPTPVTDTAVAQTAEVAREPVPEALQPKVGEQNAQQIISPTQVHGDVLNAPRPQEGAGEMPANIGGEGVPARGQGETLQQSPQEVANVPTEQVAPANAWDSMSRQERWDFLKENANPTDLALRRKEFYAMTDKPFSEQQWPDWLKNRLPPVPEGQQAPAVPEQPKPIEASAATPTEKPPVQTGVSSERFGEQYGDLAPVANTGRSASELKAIGQSRLDNFQKTGDVKDDPYAVITNLREGKVPVGKIADDLSLLRAEHQRLKNAAVAAEGTPEYETKAQDALNMAQAIKEVGHGPGSDIMRSFQEYDQPKYDNFTDFDQAMRERMGRESTPSEKAQFEKIANDRVRTRDVADSETSTAQKQVQQYRGREKMSFDDAAKSIRDQIAQLTKDCII